MQILTSAQKLPDCANKIAQTPGAPISAVASPATLSLPTKGISHFGREKKTNQVMSCKLI